MKARTDWSDLNVSLLFLPRPLMFYFARQASCGHDAAKLREFDGKWEKPKFRELMRRITLVWGTVYFLEFTAKVVLVHTLTIPTVLVLGPIPSYSATFATLFWTFAYVARVRRASEAANTRPADASRA